MEQGMNQRPVWAEIDLAAIRHNVEQIKSLLTTGTRLCAVVKADAYGHGAVKVARAALAAGADYLAVALADEGWELRRAGVTAPILILGDTPADQAATVVDYDLSQTVFSLAAARALAGYAARAGKPARVHIKIDTGMGRIGVRPEDAGGFAAAVAALPGIKLEGAFSHFATADSRDKTFAGRQFSRFQAATDQIENRGLPLPIKHIANSAAILDLPATHLDMVRAGIIIYGLWPSAEVSRPIDLRPAMKFKARVSFVKQVPTGTAISYGCTFRTSRDSIIATLPVGYADGWTRLLSGKAQVIIRGRRAPLVGRICMDQCMVDVSDIPGVALGDEALLFGGPELPVEELADHIGTINYEIVCMVGKRVPRHFIAE